MRRPVQVWSSYFWKSPSDPAHNRDLQRAQREWKGEHRIYLNPKVKKVIRWNRRDQGAEVRECVVPSETTNVLSITHVDGHGRVYPFIPFRNHWHGSISGSYLDWMQEPAKIYMIQSDEFPIPMATVEGGNLYIHEIKIKIAPGPISSDFKLNNDDGTFQVAWKNPSNARILSPNQEITSTQAPTRYEQQKINGHEYLIALSEKRPAAKAMSSDVGWDEPFNYLFSAGGGLDLMMHQALFKESVNKIKNGNTEVRREAETWLSQMVSNGTTSTWFAWFAPMAMANQQEALFALESQYNLSANNINDLYQSAGFHEIMNTSVDIMIANGWLGYMWWDFYQDMIEKVAVRYCQACGRIIRGGHHDRRFCNRSENQACFRKRNATSQRRKRILQ